MKTKQALLLLCAGFITLTATAQDFKCADSFKALESKVTSQAYDDALAILPALRKSCPKYSDKLYFYGEAVLIYKSESAQTPEDEKVFNQELVNLYTEQERNFPGTGGDEKKALLLFNKKMAKDDEVYKILDNAFTSKKEGFTDFNAIELYFNLFLKQYDGGKGAVTQEQFIQKYSDIAAQAAYAKSRLLDKIAALTKKQDTEELAFDEKIFMKQAKSEQNSLDSVSESIALQAAKYFDCTKLDAYYSAGYEKNKANIAWLEAMVTALNENKCYKSATLFDGALALHKNKATYKSAYLLGNLSLRKGDKKGAIDYFNQAVDLQPDPIKKSETYSTIATAFRNDDKAEAKKYALKAAEANPKSGKPYLFLAELYASASMAKDCNLSNFDKKALAWLSIATAKKAEVAEPRYKTTVAALIDRNFNKKLPTAAEIKAAGKKKGDTITFGCWVNETITIPN
ncbi:hypothetical protein FMM05_03590 [Flavobacterium zepuense]|uniref:Uncharacterized protein n=1 Tax=Flavobacterium zepuense TaxID=2593302 RepID=A0A552V7N9_9FLAO|nr:hypothetical protein [Flavobacterium zepuense]TRW26475.1 hypothetical protein FMM05_03590 [Flavobacterium zepuense]